MRKIIRKIRKQIILLINRAKFHLFFKRVPGKADYCNSMYISVLFNQNRNALKRDYLVFIRCGTEHKLIDDGGERNFDIALNLYSDYMDKDKMLYEYLFVGGINKFKAAFQFINNDLLNRYKGFIFLDDDLEISYSDLSGFLQYCTNNNVTFAQPSLTQDSHYSYNYLLNKSCEGWRPVDMVEVMCPFFSTEALKLVSRTFNLSYSTWGLMHIWPKLVGTAPAVVDEFKIKHTRPHNSDGSFYKYMKEIGICPMQEKIKLKGYSVREILEITDPLIEIE